ncbi:MAG: ATP-binding protein [Pseudomonadota bacterium]
MATYFQATPAKREYNQWVANETMEDFALRYTARRARRWSMARVANTAIGSISFLALEAIGAAITLSYGFDTAVVAIMLVGLILFATGLPISYYAARYGVDIDLLTRGAGFGYIGSTITSLIYATFTFIFFALEAAILGLALEFCFGIPLFIGYILSSVVVIPLVIHGFTKISAFQAWTQPFWIILHLLPFALLLWFGINWQDWTGFTGLNDAGADGMSVLMLGAASGVVLSLAAQIGEQVDFLRFLPEPKTRAERRAWWLALIAAGPGWAVLGVLKMLAGSYLVTLALSQGLTAKQAADPTHMYYTAFDMVLAMPGLALFLTGAFVILSQLKINVTNAYAGSIAWSNFFSRLTHSHPGRVVWLVFNVAIALMLMEFGVFGALEVTLALYSHVALAWIGALVADLVINKPLGLSPPGIEFRRAYLHDINPVGIGAMSAAVILSLLCSAGLFGQFAGAISAFIALGTAFLLAPLIAKLTQGRYYLAREATPPAEAMCTCSVCNYRFDREDMADCPFYGGQICSLCCSLDSNCRDFCKPEARLSLALSRALHGNLPAWAANIITSKLALFLLIFSICASALGAILLIIANFEGTGHFTTLLGFLFCATLVVVGIGVWMLILIRESRTTARAEAERQNRRLLREIRAHERTDRELQSAKEKAEAANLAKTRYLTGLSHELRTPLNSIFGFAQILEADPNLPENRQTAVSTIRRSSEHLAGLIEGLLDISKIEAGRLQIYRERINLPEFLRQITNIFAERAEAKGLDFRLETEGALPGWVLFDEKRLRQIIINLLSNAIRYTDAGSVVLRVVYRNEIATIETVDTGQGINPEMIDRIWKPFERGHRSDTIGSGLGLTITKLLVEILGGDIAVESQPGIGSTFRVRLMLPSIPDHRARPALERSVAERGHATGYTGRRRTLMIVDDDESHLDLAESFFTPLGFHLARASSAEETLERLADITPDAFILDIDLPTMDGWALATRLRQTGYRSTPIIMVSGHALEARHSRRKDKGPEAALYDAFVPKPYNLSDLLERLAGLLKLTLTFEGDRPDAAPKPINGAASIPKDALASMLKFADIGHASALRERLEEVMEDRSEPSAQIEELASLLDSYEMTKIADRIRSWMRR